ncbi:hypothetical protein [Streptomyces sp. NPDC047718]|uniref:hypothetical protein n=1 Tax=Streptomyces sp. NPDC047718 TaxID=3155479 RepID=UPI0033F73FBB
MAADVVARVQPGVRIYPEPPANCYWSAGVCFWRVQPGNLLVRVHRLIDARNKHRPVRAAVVDLWHENGQQLSEVALPSGSLSRDVDGWSGWVAVRVLRDGAYRPWRAVPIPGGPWVARAAELNGAA